MDAPKKKFKERISIKRELHLPAYQESLKFELEPGKSVKGHDENRKPEKKKKKKVCS